MQAINYEMSAGQRCLTPCPFNVGASEGADPHMVSSMACRLCGHFVSDDAVNKIVRCLNNPEGMKDKKSSKRRKKN